MFMKKERNIMTKPSDSPTKKTLRALAEEFPDKTYKELEKYRDADRVEEAIGIGHNHPPMKEKSYPDLMEENNELKNRIADFEETLKSRDYFRQHDYKFLVEENHKLEQERNELLIDNRKLSAQIEDKVDQMRKSGL